jgi:hypothetical protein
VRPGEDLVDPGAAANAHAAAVADTVFAFIAALGPAAKIFGAARGAAGAADAAAAAAAAEARAGAEAGAAEVGAAEARAGGEAGAEAVAGAGEEAGAGGAGATRPPPVPEPAPAAPVSEPASGGGVPASARPPAAGGQSGGAPPSKPAVFTVEETNEIFRRAIAREPTLSLQNLERDVDAATFRQAWKNAGGTGKLPAGFVDPKTNRIWIRGGKENTLTLFHESVHQYSMVNKARAPFLNEFGDFLEEGITENVTRETLGPNWFKHDYDKAVLLIDQMEQHLGVPRQVVTSAYLDGKIDAFRAAIQAGLGGDPGLAGTFIGAVRNVGSTGANTKALRDALYMMIVKRPPPP